MTRIASDMRRSAPQLLALAVILVLDRLAAPGFFDLAIHGGRLVGSLVDVLDRAAPVGLLALGMAPVIATGGIDLSVGAVMAIAGAVMAAAVSHGAPWQVAVVAALAAGALSGAWNGVLVAVLGIQPFVATLVLMVAGRGIAQLVTQGRILTFVEPHLTAIGSGSALGLPLPVLILAVATALAVIFLRTTALGLFIEAVGGSRRASRLAGVNSKGVTVSVYIGSGLAAAIAGLIVAGDISGADANNAGLWSELDAILAVAIGGASLAGGRFSLTRTVIAALAIQALKTGILLTGLPPEFNLLLMAGAVVLVLCLQSPALRPLAARLRERGA